MNEIDELKSELETLAEEMRPQHLSIAVGLGEGKTMAQAYIDSGGASREPDRCCSDMVKRSKKIQRYMQIAKKIAALTAQDALNYDEQDWLRTQLKIQAMALGESELVGVDGDYKQTDLTQANKSQDLLGKRYGLFSETKIIEGNLTVDSLIAEMDADIE